MESGLAPQVTFFSVPRPECSRRGGLSCEVEVPLAQDGTPLPSTLASRASLWGPPGGLGEESLSCEMQRHKTLAARTHPQPVSTQSGCQQGVRRALGAVHYGTVTTRDVALVCSQGGKLLRCVFSQTVFWFCFICLLAS